MLEKFDNFGQNLQLQFSGSTAFKSNVGGVASLLVYLLVLCYSIQKGLKLINHDDATIVTFQKKADDFGKEKQKFVNLGENGFDLMVYIM